MSFLLLFSCSVVPVYNDQLTCYMFMYEALSQYAVTFHFYFPRHATKQQGKKKKENNLSLMLFLHGHSAGTGM